MRTPVSRPKGAVSNEQAAERIRKWMLEYWDTQAVLSFLGSDQVKEEYLRSVLHEHPDETYNANQGMGHIRGDLELHESDGQYRMALELIDRHARIAPLIMTADNWKEFQPMLRSRRQELVDKATSRYNQDMTRARELVRGDNRDAAVRTLTSIAKRYGGTIAAEALQLLREKYGERIGG